MVYETNDLTVAHFVYITAIIFKAKCCQWVILHVFTRDSIFIEDIGLPFFSSGTCPIDALTSKPEPRYLFIVFDLAGDSTITSDFFDELDFAIDKVQSRLYSQYDFYIWFTFFLLFRVIRHRITLNYSVFALCAIHPDSSVLFVLRLINNDARRICQAKTILAILIV